MRALRIHVATYYIQLKITFTLMARHAIYCDHFNLNNPLRLTHYNVYVYANSVATLNTPKYQRNNVAIYKD